MRKLLVIPVLFLVACSVAAPGTAPAAAPSTQAPSAPGYEWSQVAPAGSGAFPADWHPGKWPMGLYPISAFGGELWMLGQTSAWSSHDALVWARHSKSDWGERLSPAYAYFRGKLWMFGGQQYTSTGPSTGKDAGAFFNDVWVSADGTSWTRAGQAAWPARKGHAVVAFKDRLWLLGGADHVLTDGTSDRFLNDVWTSDDGERWTEVTDAAPWSPREHPHVVLFGDAMFMTGDGQADVWRSTDGVTWTEVTPQAAWGARHGYGSAAFDGRLWVYGGWPSVPTDPRNDVWSSPDGLRWTRETEHAPWSERTGDRTVAFRDRLWVYSGKHTGSPDSWSGDIWTMSKRA